MSLALCFRLLNTADLLRCLINLHGRVFHTGKHLCMACIVMSCLLFHCMSGMSPRQIPVDILMSLANKYPCIYSVLMYWSDSKLVQSKHVYMYIIIIIIIIVIMCLLLQRIPGEAELIWWQSWWWCSGQRINTGTNRQICYVKRVCYVEGACYVDGGCYLNSAAIRGNWKFQSTVVLFLDLFVPLR